jgi:hypothetical protein
MTSLVTEEMLDAFAVEAPWDGLSDAVCERYTHVDRAVLYTPPYRGDDRWETVLGG